MSMNPLGCSPERPALAPFRGDVLTLRPAGEMGRLPRLGGVQRADRKLLPFPVTRDVSSDKHQPFENQGARPWKLRLALSVSKEHGVPRSQCPLSSELPKPGEVTALFPGAIYNFQRTPAPVLLCGASEK